MQQQQPGPQGRLKTVKASAVGQAGYPVLEPHFTNTSRTSTGVRQRQQPCGPLTKPHQCMARWLGAVGVQSNTCVCGHSSQGMAPVGVVATAILWVKLLRHYANMQLPVSAQAPGRGWIPPCWWGDGAEPASCPQSWWVSSSSSA